MQRSVQPIRDVTQMTDCASAVGNFDVAEWQFAGPHAMQKITEDTAVAFVPCHLDMLDERWVIMDDRVVLLSHRVRIHK